VWLLAGSGLLAGLATCAVLLTLAALLRRRQDDTGFANAARLLALFILACSVGRSLAVATMPLPAYRLDEAFRLLTSGVSLLTASALWLLMPRSVADRSPQQLQHTIETMAETEEQLRQANMYLELAECIAHVGHWRLRLPDRTLTWSDELYRIFGVAKESFTPHVDAAIALYIDPDQAEVRRSLDDVIANRSTYEHSVTLRRPSGELRHVLVRGVCQVDATGAPAALFGVVLDQTQDRQNRVELDARDRLARQLVLARDAAEQANQAKTRFLAAMSHELRTPLNGILGYAELLSREGGLTKAQADRVAVMLGAGRHLLDLISKVLDFSAIEAGHLTLRTAPVDGLSAAEACVDLVRPAAAAKRLSLSISGGADVTLLADPVRLRQILVNLLGNAVKFTSEGGVELRLAAVPKRAVARIEVADTGPGIPPGQQTRLFRDFERLDNDIVASIEGAGLGLALSARLATSMGGRLGYEDNPGGGSLLWLELPLGSAPGHDGAAKAGQPANARAAPCADAPSGVRGLSVLVVDDVDINREVAAAFLQMAGCHVQCVDSGASAVRAVMSGKFDVILMDICMPEVDGLEATRQIRAISGPQARTAILGLSAQAFAEHVQACRTAGMDGHLTKPYTPDELINTVAAMADRFAHATA
jgi:signal transduction histidine kinase/CheY-like chemotaxis protein